nr:N-acetylmuramoyl-L-alanine amidase [Myxococcota bacterium]
MTLRSCLGVVIALVLALPGVAAAQPLIVIDAGHGGSDPGAVGCSLQEANVVLDVTQRLRVLLEGAGVRVALTRDDDTFVGLSARAAYANSRAADGFFSVHSNANSGTPATGTETFVITGAGARSRSLGAGIQAAMIAAWGLRDRGLKEANFAVLRETTMPAALGELAFTNRCDPDAVLLGDPAARQRLAEHVRDAVLRWLGIDPMTPTTGTLRGVVFEDQGVGAEDLTVRLPGASVRVMPGDASATADATEGAWSFALMPGEYTVEASHAGHVMATRTCTVTSGMTTWCSIGLLPEAVMEIDAGMTEETDAAVIEEDAAVTIETDGGEGRAPVEGCGCAVPGGGRGSAGGMLASLLAVGLVIARRRRGRTVIASAAMIALAIGCAHEGAPREAVELRTGATDPAPVVIASTTAGARATLGAPREWLAEGYVSPLIAPDGAHVLLSTESH